MKIYTPSREERAFLYQEAQDLEGLMKNLGSLSVMVEEMTAAKKGRKTTEYRVTFVLAPESVGMKVQATDGSLFEATIAAKEEAQRQLNAIVNSMPRTLPAGDKSSKINPEILH